MRFRRSISLGGGFRVNVNKGSLGLSAGGRGIRYSVNSSGRSTRSVGVPGTGLYYRSQTGPAPGRSGGRATSRPSGSNRQATEITPEIVERVIPRPGFLASNTEKRFRERLVAYLQQRWSDAAQLFQMASATDSRNLSDDFLLGASLLRLERAAEGAVAFEKVVRSPEGLPDELMRKYVPGTLTMQVPITDRVVVGAAFNSTGAARILAEIYQQLGRRPEAIGLVQKLHRLSPDDQAIRLSLADLLYDDEDFDGLITLTEGVENTDDVALAMLHLKAKALANQGMVAPAAEVLSACLRRTAGRDADLLKEIRYNRAEAYELLGDAKRAKADWTKLVVEDPMYRDARQRLEGGVTTT